MELTFSAGTTRNCQDISIENDDILEGTENLFANLVTSDPDVILEPNVTEIVISEDPNDGMRLVTVDPSGLLRRVHIYPRCDNWF